MMSERTQRRGAPAGHIGSTKIEVFESKDRPRGMLVQTDEPLCSLHVVLATEADTNDWSHKDDGLPHTLEHAIFLGLSSTPGHPRQAGERRRRRHNA